MMVAAIVHAQDQNEDEREMGPFETILRRLDQIERVARDALNSNKYDTRPYREDYYRQLYGSSPTWVYSPNTSTGGSYTAVSTSSSTMASTEIADIDIKELLKDLKFNE